MFKCQKKLKVIEYENYKNKEGKVVQQIVLGDVDRFLRYTFKLPDGIPRPQVGVMVLISIDLKEYNGRLYPVLTNIE